MKDKKLVITAIACGVACAGCIAGFMYSVQGEADAARAEALARYGGEQVEVCVATRDVVSGERVDASAVETRLWIADLLPDGAVREASDIVGRTATSGIIKGEVISEKRFESNRSVLDIPAGKEAVSVPAKAVQAVGGAIQPGMSVDVYSSGDTSTAAIARGVVVLDTSVGAAGSLVSSESGWITLAVDPESVQEFISASGKTSLYFVIPGERVEAPAESSGAAPSASSKSATKGMAAPSAEGAENPDQGPAGSADVAGGRAR